MSVGVAVLKRAVKRAQDEHRERWIPVNRVIPNPEQPREYFNPKAIAKLARSIKSVGQKDPAIVSPIPGRNGWYDLVDGERRFRATLKLKREAILAIVRRPESTEDSYIGSVIVNFNHEPHTPYETARAIIKIMDMKRFTVPEVAEIFGRSTGWVQQHLSLAKLDPKVIAMMDFNRPRAERLKFSIALLLVSLPPELQVEIAQGIVEGKMKMTMARHYVREMAAKNGFKVGMGARPRKARASFSAFLNNTLSSLATFDPRDLPLTEMLGQFKKEGLNELLSIATACRDGMEKIAKAIAQVQAQ